MNDERGYNWVDRYGVICRPGKYTRVKSDDSQYAFYVLMDVEYPNGTIRPAKEVDPLRIRTSWTNVRTTT